MKNFWKNKKVLITGHTGFKGSWLSLLLKYLDCEIFGISSEKREGIYNLSSIGTILNEELFMDISDINKNKIFQTAIKNFDPEIVFHFAAQSLVIEGFKNPRKTITSNIIGPFNLIENLNSVFNEMTVVVATTDKVYKFPQNVNSEDFELGGKDFYSNTKVGKELLIDAFKNHPEYRGYNFSKVRSGNVIGGGERAENRLFTDLINSIKENKDIIVRNPNHIRPWQYVLDSLYGYLLIGEESFTNNVSKTFNLNSEINNKYSVLEIVELFKKFSKLDKEITINEELGYEEVKKLKIDSTKAEKELGWIAKKEIPEIIELIVKWENFHDGIKTPDYSFNEIDQYLSS